MHNLETNETLRGIGTDGAWLSSARVVRCWVKSRNERNPHVKLLHSVENSLQTAADSAEEGGDDVKSSCLLRLGLQACYNGDYKVLPTSNGEPITKKSSQFGLRAETRPHEVGFASNPESACRGEYVPGSCTHRLSRHGSWRYPKSFA